MKFNEFEGVVSAARMGRYVAAFNNDTKKAMTLYRKNLKLSQELFTIISCFEIALRNNINTHCLINLGNDWLRNSAIQGGRFDNYNCRYTKTNINDAIHKLRNTYAHNKLVAELGFGFWRFMFASHQYTAMGRTLLAIFPQKPVSTAAAQYNQTYVFNQLIKINELRNRIAHREPICFIPGQATKDTAYVRQHYALIKQLFQWMNIDEAALLYGIDHINTVCNEIDAL